LKNKNIDLEVIKGISSLVQNFDQTNKDYFFSEVFSFLHKIIAFDHAAIFLFDTDKQQIQLSAQEGQAIDLIEAVEFEFGKGFSAWVAKEKRPILLKNLKGISQTSRHIHSFLSVPLLLESELIGVINFGHQDFNAISEEIIPELQIITSILAGLLNNGILVGKLKQQNEDIARINKELHETHDKLIAMEKRETIAAMTVSLNHEINNPLMIISGNLQILKETASEEREVRRLRIIEEQVERIANVLQKLRELQEPYMEKYLDGDKEKMIKLTN